MHREEKHRIRPKTLAKARELRQPQTPAEKKLWARLRAGQVEGLKFRRQRAIGRFIVDFYCPACKLVVEIDGDTHARRKAYDASRTRRLTQEGYEVIRFTNEDIHCRLALVVEEILSRCRRTS